MPANDLNLSIHNPLLIYSFLALYGVLTVFVLAYVHTKFRFATRTLKALKVEWDSADSRHEGFVGKAQEQISKLAVGAVCEAQARQGAASRIDRPGAHRAPLQIGFDVRNQVVSMGKKGFKGHDIARVCNLAEGEVEVLLGMARLQR